MWGAPPPDGATIWRYFSLPKLLHTLQKKSLFFPSVSMLEDPWEGHWTEDEFQNVIATFKKLPDFDLDWANVIREVNKKSTFVSCWHQSDHESAAMWTTYGTEGIGVKSTVGALKSAFEVEERPIGIAVVRYTDQLPDVPPLTQAVFRKRPSFEHEHEIRAVCFDSSAQEDGIHVRVELEKLVQGIYVSPRAPLWLRAVLREVLETELKRDGLQRVPVALSSLYDPL